MIHLTFVLTLCGFISPYPNNTTNKKTKKKRDQTTKKRERKHHVVTCNEQKLNRWLEIRSAAAQSESRLHLKACEHVKYKPNNIKTSSLQFISALLAAMCDS